MREDSLASSHGRSGFLAADSDLRDASASSFHVDVGKCSHAAAICRCRKSL